MSERKGDYGTIHVMEEEMREAEQGVFERKSGRRKAAPASPETKMDPAPANKSVKPAKAKAKKNG